MPPIANHFTPARNRVQKPPSGVALDGPRGHSGTLVAEILIGGGKVLQLWVFSGGRQRLPALP